MVKNLGAVNSALKKVKVTNKKIDDAIENFLNYDKDRLKLLNIENIFEYCKENNPSIQKYMIERYFKNNEHLKFFLENENVDMKYPYVDQSIYTLMTRYKNLRDELNDVELKIVDFYKKSIQDLGIFISFKTEGDFDEDF